MQWLPRWKWNKYLCSSFCVYVASGHTKIQTCIVWIQGPVSRTSREIFGPEKVVVKLQSACFEKLTFLHVFNIRKTKRIAKYDGLDPRRCEGIKGIVAPEIDPKSFGTFEKRAPGLNSYSYVEWSPEKGWCWWWLFHRHQLVLSHWPSDFTKDCRIKEFIKRERKMAIRKVDTRVVNTLRLRTTISNGQVSSNYAQIF